MTPNPIREAETAPAGMSALQLTNEMAWSHFPFPFSWAKIQSLEKKVKKRGFLLNNSLEEWKDGGSKKSQVSQEKKLGEAGLTTSVFSMPYS